LLALEVRLMHKQIQELGAEAARHGLRLWDCPYYRAAAMPGHTGESIARWLRRVQAWETGWKREIEKRRPHPW